MTTDNATNATIAALFGEPISVYTAEDAIADGFLVHPYPQRWPWALVTSTVFELCEATGKKDGRGVHEVLIPLMIDAIVAVRKVLSQTRGRADRVELEFTAAGTVIITPNCKGGLTIMLPHEE